MTELTYADKIISGMIPIELSEPDGFRKVKETLTRMGVPSKLDKTLYQSCHILHRQGKYYIAHFKEMFALDGRDTDISTPDIARRNVIASLLEQWGLVKVMDQMSLVPMGKPSLVKIIKHAEVEQWSLQPKYAIGDNK